MSTNHTPNYNLCQWEATDQVLRSDFNADNAKIDAALGALQAGALRIVADSYGGTGETEKIISLPFFPKVFFIQTVNGTEDNHIIWIEGSCCMFQPSRTPTVVYNTMDGFSCDITTLSSGPRVKMTYYNDSLSNAEKARFAFNVKGRGYMYFAIG